MTKIAFVLLQRGWARPFRPYEELFWLGILLSILIIWTLFKYYLDFSESRSINRKIKESYANAISYLNMQGWTTSEKNNFEGLEFPQIFIKKYKDGYLYVFKVKTKKDLSVIYFINETPVKDHKIKLHKETIINMKKVLRQPVK